MGVVVYRFSQNHAKLEALVAGVTDEEAAQRSDASAWTVAEHVHHLTLIERMVLQVLREMLDRAEEEGAPPAAPRPHSSDVVEELREMLEPFNRFHDVAFETLPSLLPDPDAPLSRSLDELRMLRGQLLAVCADAARFDMRVFERFHFYFKMDVDFYGWALIGADHEVRHVRHLRKLLGSA